MEMGDPPLVYHPDGQFRELDLSLMIGDQPFGRSGRPTRSMPGLRLLHVEIPGLALPPSPGRICIKSSENIGNGGYVNKCAPHLAPNKLTLQQSLLRQKINALRPKRRHFLKRSKSLSLSDNKKGDLRALSERRSYSADTKKEPPASDQGSYEDSRDDAEDSQDETSQDDRKIPANTVKVGTLTSIPSIFTTTEILLSMHAHHIEILIMI